MKHRLDVDKRLGAQTIGMVLEEGLRQKKHIDVESQHIEVETHLLKVICWNTRLVFETRNTGRSVEMRLV